MRSRRGPRPPGRGGRCRPPPRAPAAPARGRSPRPSTGRKRRSAAVPGRKATSATGASVPAACTMRPTARSTRPKPPSRRENTTAIRPSGLTARASKRPGSAMRCRWPGASSQTRCSPSEASQSAASAVRAASSAPGASMRSGSVPASSTTSRRVAGPSPPHGEDPPLGRRRVEPGQAAGADRKPPHRGVGAQTDQVAASPLDHPGAPGGGGHQVAGPVEAAGGDPRAAEGVERDDLSGDGVGEQELALPRIDGHRRRGVGDAPCGEQVGRAEAAGGVGDGEAAVLGQGAQHHAVELDAPERAASGRAPGRRSFAAGQVARRGLAQPALRAEVGGDRADRGAEVDLDAERPAGRDLGQPGAGGVGEADLGLERRAQLRLGGGHRRDQRRRERRRGEERRQPAGHGAQGSPATVSPKDRGAWLPPAGRCSAATAPASRSPATVTWHDGPAS